MKATLPTGGATTGVGSLPHTDPETACEFVFSSGCTIPYWPQLPRRDYRERMIPQYAADLPGLRLDDDRKRYWVERGEGFLEALTTLYERLLRDDAEFPLREEFTSGFYAFERRLADAPQKPLFVKGQLTGPFTFTLGLNDADGRPIYADAQMRDAALRLIVRSAAWQTERLGALARAGVILFIDEPVAAALGTAAYLAVQPEEVTDSINRVVEAVHQAGGLAGTHCCGATDWSLFAATELDILNFDAWNYFDNLAAYSAHVGRFLERGGLLAFGIVPTDRAIAEVTADQVGEKFRRQRKTLAAKGIPTDLLSRRLLLTPSCGCGSLSVAESEKVFALLERERRVVQEELG
ncbi:MAG: hypothetical protein R6V58_15785 [Planctomycetota bacterium]